MTGKVGTGISGFFGSESLALLAEFRGDRTPGSTEQGLVGMPREMVMLLCDQLVVLSTQIQVQNPGPSG